MWAVLRLFNGVYSNASLESLILALSSVDRAVHCVLLADGPARYTNYWINQQKAKLSLG